jgi:protease-4
MQTESDLLVDRKRLKSRLSLWRLMTLFIIFGGGALAVNAVDDGQFGSKIHGDYIALVSIEGEMFDSPWREDTMKEIAENPRIKALVVRLDSPGGTAIAGEELYLHLQAVAKNKPVVGVMRTVCASACYMASLGTDHVIARESTLTGSIGVLLQSMEVSRLADKLGITPITITSGAMKDVPSLTAPFTDTQRKIVAETVVDVYEHFVQKIVTHRKMDEALVRKLADGRVYTGSQALKLNLIDGLGGQDEALAWLENTHKIPADLELHEIKEEREFESLIEQLGSYANQKIFGRSEVQLDGLLSIWHPSLIH